MPLHLLQGRALRDVLVQQLLQHLDGDVHGAVVLEVGGAPARGGAAWPQRARSVPPPRGAQHVLTAVMGGTPVVHVLLVGDVGQHGVSMYELSDLAVVVRAGHGVEG